MIRTWRMALCVLSAAVVLAVCGCAGVSAQSASSATSSASSASSEAAAPAHSAASESGVDLPDGSYRADFDTDSSMFHVNEADDGKGVLTVDGEGATIHVSLVSKKIVKLYAGSADDAKVDAAHVIEPTLDTVTYSDGYQEEVHGFDIPVPVLDEEFDVAILGEKGTWYDHKVSVSNPVAE